MTVLSRRNFMKTATVAGVGALAAACTPAAPQTQQPVEQPTQPPASQGPVSLKVLAENWGEIYNGLMTKIGDALTEEKPDIKLEWEFEPDWRTKLTTLLAANTPPDLAFMRGDFLASIAPKGVLLALDDLVKGAGKKREDFVTPLWDSGAFKGVLYALPGGADVWNYYYNKGIFTSNGLDPEKPPTSLAELSSIAQKVTKYDADGNIEVAPMMFSTGWLPQWIYLFGGELYNESEGKITANAPKNVEAFTWLKGYWQSMGDIDKLTAFAQRPGFFEAGNPFSTGQCTFVIDGFWYYEAIDQHAPDIKYGVGYWPTVNGTEEEKKNWMLGGWQYSIPKGVKNPDISWAALQYMFIDKSAKMGVDTLNGTCVKAQFQEWIDGLTKKIGSENRMAPYLQTFTVTSGLATKYFPIIENQAFYGDELARVFDLMIRNQIEPQAALDEVQKNVQADLDKIRSGAN